MNKEVQIEHIWHHDKACVLVRFSYKQKLIDVLKQGLKAKWSHSYKAWYIEYTLTAETDIATALKQLDISFELINEYSPFGKNLICGQQRPLQAIHPLPENKSLKVEQFKKWMQSRRYSENTIKTYVNAVSLFLRFFGHKEIETISNEDLVTFNNDYIIKHKFSASFQNQVVNGLKLFYKTVENKTLIPDLMHRPKSEFILPKVLSIRDIEAILRALDNIKHKAMLALIYSVGLRRSELINLEITDIDSKRMLITIRAAKGKKDRVVPLSASVLGMLRTYYINYQPKTYLFEGQRGGRYSETSLQEVFKKALKASKVNKPVSLHSLRHSYATHLLEGGINLRYIQEILGHKNPRTTQIYTHVSTEGIGKVMSPIEKMNIIGEK